jgi:ComF family protein
VPSGDRCECHELDPHLDMVRSAAVYENWVRKAIIAFKYEGERARSSHLGDLAVRLVPEFGDAVLIPVPLHPRRLRERGYNQSALLAHVIGDASGRSVDNALRRIVDTRHQVGLAADERASNVRGAFALTTEADMSGRRCVVVDDVLTTGATLGACAATLKTAGAIWVGALTIARER